MLGTRMLHLVRRLRRMQLTHAYLSSTASDANRTVTQSQTYRCTAGHPPDNMPCRTWHTVCRSTMNAINQQIGAWLGVPPPATETEILRIVEGQLAPSIITRLLALGLTRSEIDQTVIASRTLQHRRSRREKLTIEETDRVLRMIRVLSSSEAIYGSRQRALDWLRNPHPRLNDRAPLSLLRSDTGSRIVEELLVQIDEGIFL